MTRAALVCTGWMDLPAHTQETVASEIVPPSRCASTRQDAADEQARIRSLAVQQCLEVVAALRDLYPQGVQPHIVVQLDAR